MKQIFPVIEQTNVNAQNLPFKIEQTNVNAQYVILLTSLSKPQIPRLKLIFDREHRHTQPQTQPTHTQDVDNSYKICVRTKEKGGGFQIHHTY